MENSINERIKRISNFFFDGNISAMARITLIKQPTLRDIIGERGSAPSFETIRGLVDCATLNINPDWLIRGEGEMQNCTPEDKIQRLRQVMTALDIDNAQLSEKIDITEKNIERVLSGELPIGPNMYSRLDAIGINLGWFLRLEGSMFKDDISVQILNESKAVEKVIEEQGVPLYDVSAAANLRTLFDNKNQNILGKISIPDMPKCDGAVYVTGDSMYPLLKSGDIIVYKEVRDFSSVIFGEMYLVSFEIDGDEYLTVKYVNSTDQDGYIKLVSYNTHHDPKDVPLNSVRAMALVKLSIRKNTMI